MMKEFNYFMDEAEKEAEVERLKSEPKGREVYCSTKSHEVELMNQLIVMSGISCFYCKIGRMHHFVKKA